MAKEQSYLESGLSQADWFKLHPEYAPKPATTTSLISTLAPPSGSQGTPGGPSLDPSDPRYDVFRKKGYQQYDPGVFQSGQNFFTLNQQGQEVSSTKEAWAKANPGQDVFDVGGWKRQQQKSPPAAPAPPPAERPAPLPPPAAPAPTSGGGDTGGTPPEMPASPSLQGLRSAMGGGGDGGPGMTQELTPTGLRPGLGTRMMPQYSATLAGLRNAY